MWNQTIGNSSAAMMTYPLVYAILKHQHPHLKDSPAVPPSAAAHELFRGFSFVSPGVVEERRDEKKIRTIPTAKTHPITDDYLLKEFKRKKQLIRHGCVPHIYNVPLSPLFTDRVE
ncbi:unnamed protein product [Nippostrongylus brasiliensis]|uniref:Uncharacterized protein n=1 Tax=Nippostrongylus brasiliensis TaxID=27835 RepID=A0A0N4Y0Q0_NIPBR|nr:unnamed protein product [Nippostrongylus brasiliensis]